MNYFISVLTAIVVATSYVLPSVACCLLPTFWLLLSAAYFLLFSFTYLQLSTFHCLYNTAYFVFQIPACCYLPTCLPFLVCSQMPRFCSLHPIIYNLMLAAYSLFNNVIDHLKPPTVCCLRPTDCCLLAITYFVGFNCCLQFVVYFLHSTGFCLITFPTPQV